MKTHLAAILVVGAGLLAEVVAQSPPEKNSAESQPAERTTVGAPKVPPQSNEARQKPRKIAHGGCYYPFPIPENDPAEPQARQYSIDRGAEYLDGLTRRWNNEAGCVTCHTTLPYYTCRPALGNVPGSAMHELREFMEYRVAHWDSDKPLWDAEVLITAVSLAVHDASATGKLQPPTQIALDRMWSLQREDGSWNWLKAGTPPFEADDYYGAVLVAVGIGGAPDNYAKDDRIGEQVAKLRQYFARKQPPNLHHAAWLMWAEARLGGVMTKELRDQKISALAALQKTDGGWSLPSLGGWKAHDGSPVEQAPADGYATGLVVYALRQSGMPSDHEVIRKGTDWLKTHQRESGSWFTGSLGTRYHLNFLSHSATAFALMALKACE